MDLQESDFLPTLGQARAGEPVAVIAWGNGRRDGVSFEISIRHVDLSVIVSMLQGDAGLLAPEVRSHARELAEQLRAMGVEPLL